MYKALKEKNKRYPIRMYQVLNKQKYKNAKYIYSQYLIEVQELNQFNTLTKKIPYRRMPKEIVVVEMPKKKYLQYIEKNK